MSATDNLRYPIGPMPVLHGPATPRQRAEWVDAIERLPPRLRGVVRHLIPAQWDALYRPGGWTVRQLVHHLVDSHRNAYVRFKLALTEDEPTIKPDDEAAWAQLADTFAAPPGVSLQLLDALQARWVVLLRAISAPDYRRTLRHPEHGRVFTLDDLLAQYAWHSDHHTRNITALGEREAWTLPAG